MKRIKKKPHCITINQISYIEEIFNRFKIGKCILVGTLFDAISKLLKILDEELKNVQRKMECASYSLRFKIKVTFGHNCVTKRLVKFLSNFTKWIGMLPETM